MQIKQRKRDKPAAKSSLLKALVLSTMVLSLARAENAGKYLVPVLSRNSPPNTLILVSIEAELLGLRHRNNTASTNLSRVSMAGGLELFIDGAGFDDQPHISSVMFTSTQGEAVTLKGPALNSKYLFGDLELLG